MKGLAFGEGAFFFSSGDFLSKIFLSESLLSNFLACPVLSSICVVLGFLARGFLSGRFFSVGNSLSETFLVQGPRFGEGIGVWGRAPCRGFFVQDLFVRVSFF